MFTVQYLNANTAEWQNWHNTEAFEASREAEVFAYNLTDKFACKLRVIAGNGKITAAYN